MRRFLHRLDAFFRSTRAEEELAREVAAHVALLEAEYRRRGMTPADADFAARRALGGIEQAKEQQRDARSLIWLEDLRRDVRHSVRSLRRTPGFAATAILTLALGIGATTAIFSIVDAVMLKTLPVAAPEQLVVLEPVSRRDGSRQNASYPMFERLRDERRVFAGVCAALDGTNRMDVTGARLGAQKEPARVQLVSGEYFEVLGVPAFAGRTLNPQDNREAGAGAVAVLSHAFWTRRFAADRAAIGTGLVIADQPVTVVGIAPPTFFGAAVGQSPDIWVPLTMQPRFDRGQSLLDAANVGWLRVIARLRPVTTHDQATAGVAAVLAELHAGPADSYRSARTFAKIDVTDARRGLPEFRERFGLTLRILAGIVAVILMIACANVANLLLVRAATRHREMVVRLAIGAGRRRLIRQLLTESLLLATAGGALGLFIAWTGCRILLVVASTDDTPIPIDVSPNAAILAFAALTSLAVVLVIGLVPALFASRVHIGTSLKVTTDPGGSRLPRILIVAQVALSIVLLTGAALFAQTLWNLRTRDLGFAADSLLQVRVAAEPGYTRGQLPGLTRRILERLTTTPGVASASVAQFGFATGMSRTCCVAVEGHTHTREENRDVATLGVTPGYFSTMRLPLLAGREFAAQDATDGTDEIPGVAIVNEAFARRFLGGRTPIGTRFGWGDDVTNVRYRTAIVGVAKDAVYDDPRQEQSAPLIYFPSYRADLVVIRAELPVDVIAPAIRNQIQAVDQNLEVEVGLMSDLLDRTMTREKLLARLSGFFGVLAAGLAAIGVYGLMAYTVVRRTRELGIRLALGAAQGAVLRAELRSAFRLAALGMALGVAAALLAGGVIRSQLFGISPTDPATLAWVTAVLALVAGAAAYVPARRASRVDPMIALRWE